MKTILALRLLGYALCFVGGYLGSVAYKGPNIGLAVVAGILAIAGIVSFVKSDGLLNDRRRVCAAIRNSRQRRTTR